MSTSRSSSKDVPSLDEAERVLRFILVGEAGLIAASYAPGASVATSMRRYLALAIAVVGATEQIYRAVGQRYPDQWAVLEQSAEAFMDHFVVGWLAQRDPELKRAVNTHRRRKLAVRRGALHLVESDRNKRGRWAAVVLPQDASIPITEELSEGLTELTTEIEERLYQHLGAVASTDQLVLAGQAVGLLCASEGVLALLPSNEVAAFCVQLASMSPAPD